MLRLSDSFIKKGILKDFLYAHEAEVIGMLLTEFDEERYLNDLKKNIWKRGNN